MKSFTMTTFVLSILCIGSIYAAPVKEQSVINVAKNHAYLTTGKDFTVKAILQEKDFFPDVKAFTAKLVKNEKEFNDTVHSTGNMAFIKNVTNRDSKAIEPLINLVQLEPTGWLLISNDDVAKPLLGYSYDSNMSIDNLPIQAKELIAIYRLQMKHAKAMNGRPSASISDKWSYLGADNNTFKQENASEVDFSMFRTTDRDIPPLMQTAWNQDMFYNAYCPTAHYPMHGYDGRTPTGCTATAMAQIMRYHQWHSQGVGSTNYVYWDSLAQWNYLFVNHNVTFNWSLMPSTLTTYNNEVANLMYQAGTAAYMQYTDTASSASMSDANNALVHHFNYLTNGLVYRSSTNEFMWELTMVISLVSERPILYAGCSSECHAFVVDGYDYAPERLFHVNLGWGGYGNDYFTLENVTEGLSYISSQKAIFQIRPNI